MISLRNGGAELDLLPEIGGAVARFAVDGIDVLRPAPAGTANVLDTACFPLVPFANRIADGSFTFHGATVHLPRNFGDHPHALHGQGWQNAWQVLALSETAARLAYDHPAGDWPWDYTATQAFTLTPDGLRIGLTLTNRAARAMPASIGLHPYFVRAPRTRLKADVAGVWLSDATGIPTRQAEASHFLDMAQGAALASAPFVDHCHFGWSGRAMIEQPEQGRSVLLSAGPELGFLHVFVPLHGDFFCVEPVSAMPDALNRPGAFSGLREFSAGESFSAMLLLSAQAHSRERCL